MESNKEQTVKVSVQIDFALYQGVNSFPYEMGIPQAVGKARIPQVEIFRALAQELMENQALRLKIASRIIADRNGDTA